MAGSGVESIGHYGANAVRSRDASASRSGGIKTDRDIDSHGLKIGDGFFRSTNTHPARFGEDTSPIRRRDVVSNTASDGFGQSNWHNFN